MTKQVTKTISVSRTSVKVTDVTVTINVPENESEDEINGLLDLEALDVAPNVDFGDATETHSEYSTVD